MKSAKIVWLCFLMLIVCFLSMDFIVLAENSQDNKMDEITVALGTALDHSASFVAREKGIFEKYNLKVSFKIVPTGVDQIAAMQSGEAQFGQAGILPISSAVSKGFNLKMIAFLQGSATQKFVDPDMAIVANEDSGIISVEDLPGKTVGFPAGTAADNYFTAVIEDYGINRDEINIMNITDSDMEVALERGDVDAICVWEPYSSLCLVNIPGTKLVKRDGGYISRYGVVIAFEDFIKENPYLVIRYLQAFFEAQQLIRQSPEVNSEIAPVYIPGLTKEVALAASKNLAYDGRLSQKGIDGIKWNVDVLKNRGTIDIDANTVIDAFEQDYNLLIQEIRPDLFNDLPPVSEEDKLRIK